MSWQKTARFTRKPSAHASVQRIHLNRQSSIRRHASQPMESVQDARLAWKMNSGEAILEADKKDREGGRQG